MIIEFKTDSQFMKGLIKNLGVNNPHEVVKEALSLLKWLVNEYKEGRTVTISCKEDGKDTRKLVTRYRNRYVKKEIEDKLQKLEEEGKEEITNHAPSSHNLEHWKYPLDRMLEVMKSIGVKTEGYIFPQSPYPQTSHYIVKLVEKIIELEEKLKLIEKLLG